MKCVVAVVKSRQRDQEDTCTEYSYVVKDKAPLYVKVSAVSIIRHGATTVQNGCSRGALCPFAGQLEIPSGRALNNYGSKKRKALSLREEKLQTYYYSVRTTTTYYSSTYSVLGTLLVLLVVWTTPHHCNFAVPTTTRYFVLVLRTRVVLLLIIRTLLILVKTS